MLPEIICKLIQKIVKLVVEYSIKLLCTAFICKTTVDEFAVDNGFESKLLSQAVQPLALSGIPGLRGVYFFHGITHTLLKRYQCFAKCRLADIANDAGGNILIALIAPCSFEISFCKAVLIQKQAYFLQLFAGQVSGPINNRRQGSRLVDLIANKAYKTVDIIFRLFVFAIILFTNFKFVFML